jgi:ABC-type dipeptide/oligopeptide/nickel transport system permease subunit
VFRRYVVEGNGGLTKGYPRQWAPAGVAIVLTVPAISFIGDGLRGALDSWMIT